MSTHSCISYPCTICLANANINIHKIDPESFTITERIKKLESYMQDVSIRLSKLENLVSNLSQKNPVPDLSQKPHKCPVCEGERYCHSKENGLIYQCESCEGKGFVVC